MKTKILFPAVMIALLAGAVQGNGQNYTFSVIAGSAGHYGCKDGLGTNALFNHPMGLALDAADNLYVADNGNHAVRLIQADGTVSSYTNLQISIPLTTSTNAVLAKCFSFSQPKGIAVGPDGTLYVSDNDIIYKVFGSPTNAEVTLLAGLDHGYQDGFGALADFNGACGLAVDGAGTVWVAEQQNRDVRTITSNGLVGTAFSLDSSASGHDRDQFAKSIKPAPDLYQFTGIVVDSSSNVFLMDQSAYVDMLSPADGKLTNLWHTSSHNYSSSGIALDLAGNLYVFDGNSNTVDRITLAGGTTSLGALPVKNPHIGGIAVDSQKNIYLADQANNVILKGTAVYPPFFAGQQAAAPGIYDLQFSNNIPFGYYNLGNFNFPIFYHYDLGFEYFFDANDGNSGTYLYDFNSQTFWYTSPSLFPYLYDFTLNAWLYYYADPTNPGHYSANPRYFYNFGAGKIITK